MSKEKGKKRLFEEDDMEALIIPPPEIVGFLVYVKAKLLNHKDKSNPLTIGQASFLIEELFRFKRLINEEQCDYVENKNLIRLYIWELENISFDENVPSSSGYKSKPFGDITNILSREADSKGIHIPLKKSKERLIFNQGGNRKSSRREIASSKVKRVKLSNKKENFDYQPQCGDQPNDSVVSNIDCNLLATNDEVAERLLTLGPDHITNVAPTSQKLEGTAPETVLSHYFSLIELTQDNVTKKSSNCDKEEQANQNIASVSEDKDFVGSSQKSKKNKKHKRTWFSFISDKEWIATMDQSSEESSSESSEEECIHICSCDPRENDEGVEDD